MSASNSESWDTTSEPTDETTQKYGNYDTMTDAESEYDVLAGAINHPDRINPYHGLFNFRSLRALSQTNASVSVVSPRPYAPPAGPYSEYGSLPDAEDWGPYQVHHPRFWYLLPKRLFYGVSGESYAERIPAYVESNFERPDVVHTCHIYPDGYGLLPYVREHGLPLFVVSHGKLLNSYGEHPPGVSKKIDETLEAATGVLCVSEALARTARSLTDPSKVQTVPIGSDPSKFPVDQCERLRRELDISPEATVVLFVGEFSERKGIDHIAELLPDLDATDTEFVFIGHSGDLEGELKQAISESKFSARHVYSGVSSLALRRWYALADLLILPSRAEGRPTVIYEAMASETAVLATSVGGVPEQVVDGETGVLVPPNEPATFESALESLVEDNNRIRRMGEAGHQRLRKQNWTWADHARRLQEVHLAASE